MSQRVKPSKLLRGAIHWDWGNGKEDVTLGDGVLPNSCNKNMGALSLLVNAEFTTYMYIQMISGQTAWHLLEADEHFVFFFQPKRDSHRKISERNSPEEHRESDWKRKASGKILQRISARVACAPKKFRREEGEEIFGIRCHGDADGGASEAAGQWH
ncbi:hypothetical protein CEXT_773561 [Caerostris extrusa]|uniref:Uncharacterized protein n=1 Tax=Caerostris extrusa TaxID=172846 RepID=A0AAV4W4Z1_CAEEX|nr:hypothetical protein CEXT_773561 [Caerostris extrusa]